jgi:hypothetical protein
MFTCTMSNNSEDEIFLVPVTKCKRFVLNCLSIALSCNSILQLLIHLWNKPGFKLVVNIICNNLKGWALCKYECC